MKLWNCFKTLTKPEQQQSSGITHDRELPCLVENLGSNEDERHQEQLSSEQLEQLANDSTDGFYRVSCLRFSSMTSPSEQDCCLKNTPADMKCWKKPQTYHVPSISPKLWKVLAKILGIPLYPSDKPILATILHILTFASSVGFLISNIWLTASEMISDEPKRMALKQMALLLVLFFWSLLVVYSHKLAYRMLTHQSFIKYVKMHSKTILKCKTGHIIFFLGFLFAITIQYHAYLQFQADNYDSENAYVICIIVSVTRIVFSIFSFLWSEIVSLLILSVCRTHCLEIRQFIKELEKDGIYHDEIRRRTYSTSTLMSNIMDDSIQMEEIDSQSSSDETESLEPNPKSPHAIYVISENDQIKNTRNNFQNSSVRKRKKYADSHMGDHIFKNEEILHRIWKIQCSLRITSSAFKRWLICFLCLVVVWLAIWLIAWLSETPTCFEIIVFLTPLIWFAIISSAVAEVNNECQKILRFLCPTEERLKMLIYLNEAPVQMAIYGFAIKYSNLVTSAIGMVVALISGVVLQEIKSLK